LDRARGAQSASPDSVAARVVTVSSIAVGDVEARDIEVALVDLTHLSKSWDGIIGNNFMKDYKVTIDYPKQIYHSSVRAKLCLLNLKCAEMGFEPGFKWRCPHCLSQFPLIL